VNKTELMQAIIQKQDELIKIHVDYVIAHEMEGYDWNLNFKEPANKVIDELADLKKQLEECKEKDRTCDNCNWFKIGYGHCVWCLRNAPYNKKLSEKTSGYSDKWEPIKTE
jgi:hypothetical protein